MAMKEVDASWAVLALIIIDLISEQLAFRIV